MNPYQVLGIIASCLTVFAGVVGVLAMQGVPFMVAFLLVYATVILWMRGMQQRAAGCTEAEGQRRGPHRDTGLHRGEVSYR